MTASSSGVVPLVLFAAMGAAVVAVVGWGYWHVSTHADVHVSLRDVGLKTERQISGPHIDNSASTHFELTLTVDSASCRGVGAVR